IPTLKAANGSNFTHVDNIYCTTPLLISFVSCETVPSLRPDKTDHIPIIYELDVVPVVTTHVPRPLWRCTEWNEFRVKLFVALANVPRPNAYLMREEVDEAICAVHAAIQSFVDEIVEMSKPSPYSKRW
ncbi:hypothetical protein B0H17DRAFT_962494, partial [Mycena rosella]